MEGGREFKGCLKLGALRLQVSGPEVRGEATSGTRLSEAAALTWQLVGHGAIIATMHDVPAGDAARGTHHACEATGCMHATLTHSPSALPARGLAGRRPEETLKV